MRLRVAAQLLVEHKPGQFAACHFAGAELPEAQDPEGLKARAG